MSNSDTVTDGSNSNSDTDTDTPFNYYNPPPAPSPPLSPTYWPSSPSPPLSPLYAPHSPTYEPLPPRDIDQSTLQELHAKYDYRDNDGALNIIHLLDDINSANSKCCSTTYQQSATYLLLNLFHHDHILCAHNNTMFVDFQQNANNAININDIHNTDIARSVYVIIHQCAAYKFIMFHVTQYYHREEDGVECGHVYAILFNRKQWRMEIMEFESGSDYSERDRQPNDNFAMYFERMLRAQLPANTPPISVMYAIHDHPAIMHMMEPLRGFCQTIQYFWVFMRLRYPHIDDTVHAICIAAPQNFAVFSRALHYLLPIGRSFWQQGNMLMRELAHFLVVLSLYMLHNFNEVSVSVWPFNSLEVLSKMYPEDMKTIMDMPKLNINLLRYE